ncbi:MAG TPA: PfkB family carbohydrate kinase [Gammaproteobacteria bacterium]|nr:PfkB family carbohydrate kinase [Gammaproteobacteria bacterium]
MSKDTEEEKFETLVLGAAHADTILKALKAIVPGHTSPAESERAFGGVAYNIASILKQLGASVGIVTVIGDDSVSGLIRKNLDQREIPTIAILIPGFATASYTAIHGPDGDMYLAAIVKDIYNQLTVGQVAQHIVKMKKAKAWVIDGAFSHEINTFLAMAAKEAGIDVYVAVSSLATVSNIAPLLANCKGLFGNVDEINHLAQNYDVSDEGIRRSLRRLVDRGAKAAFVTHGDKGIYALDAASNETVHLKAHAVEKVVSAHGAGDTFAAATIDSLRSGKSMEEALKRGLAAAALRIESKEVNKDTLRATMEVAKVAVEQKKTFFKRNILAH